MTAILRRRILSPEEKEELAQVIQAKTLKRPDGCWQWQGTVAAFPSAGYGVFKHKGTYYGYAHRVSFATFYPMEEPFDDRDLICHSCNNPRCVNPLHLCRGNATLNMLDRKASGRARWAKRVSSDNVSLIRAYRVEGKSYAKLMREFKVCEKTLKNVFRRHTHKQARTPVTREMALSLLECDRAQLNRWVAGGKIGTLEVRHKSRKIVLYWLYDIIPLIAEQVLEFRTSPLPCKSN